MPRKCINKLAKNYYRCKDSCEGKDCKGVFFVDLEAQRMVVLRDYKMVTENKDYVELANKFINEHDSNGNFSPFDSLETTAIIMYANWLESNQFSLEKKDILTLCTNEEKRDYNGVKEHRHLERDYWHPVARIHSADLIT